MIKAIKMGGFMVSLLLLAACVTINIYFPAAQAEQAAEKIVDEIIGNPAPVEDKGAALDARQYSRIGFNLLEMLVPSAQAAQPDFNIDTPEIRKLRTSMAQRFGSLRPFFDSGALGFSGDALVAVHDKSAIPLKAKNKVSKLMTDENRDRNALYQAIAQANGHPEWEKDVRAVFAKTWVQKANAGWWYQAANGGWTQK